MEFAIKRGLTLTLVIIVVIAIINWHVYSKWVSGLNLDTVLLVSGSLLMCAVLNLSDRFRFIKISFFLTIFISLVGLIFSAFAGIQCIDAPLSCGSGVITQAYIIPKMLYVFIPLTWLLESVFNKSVE